MSPIADQLTHHLITVEQELAHIRRELARFSQLEQKAPATHDRRKMIAAQITAMSLPVSDWEDMEATLYGGNTCF
ncbi:MAG: hypothetical protein UY58_C0002G0033 [Candidatus Magasanikbacteria bacterium GW2011_GWA2_50_22]|uniref:Uncharacterized protein n=1 Tax=Candidatus Magasanikbacteria bacterium GW2011_GWA2_50_22 TaxID=1619043 RepID=A0A0G1YRC2_9BACT|nr:MAG: hypothetical protein UY58_C0002G0033 [Candidatus Magasanikbacteria bacterium GW2011_GWA2_50_22]